MIYRKNCLIPKDLQRSLLVPRIKILKEKKRSMYGRVGGRATRYVMERNPSKIGRWPPNHVYAKEANAYGKSHYEIIDDSVAENPTAKQDPYILTSQKDVHKSDKEVTEVHKLSDKQAVSGKNQPQYGAWKHGGQPRIHSEYAKFIVERSTTPEEDAEFQKSRKKDPKANTMYKRPPKDNE